MSDCRGRAQPLPNDVAAGPSPGTALKAADDASKGRGLWKITKEATEKTIRHERFGQFHKSKSDGLWWSRDKAGHGGSKWKVFEETDTGLKWKADADEFGNFLTELGGR